MKPPQPAQPTYHSAPRRSTRAWVALGGNLGDVRITFERALRWLNSDPGVNVECTSSLHRTVALTTNGLDPTQPAYLNGVTRLRTTLGPLSLLRVLQRIEVAAGRDRRVDAPRWSARPLDLDLLLYGDLGQTTLRHRTLTIPHPRMTSRAFVLGPLAELDPDLIHPAAGLSIVELAARLAAINE